MSKIKDYYLNENINENSYEENEYTSWRKFLATIGLISLFTFVPYILWSISAMDTLSSLCIK